MYIIFNASGQKRYPKFTNRKSFDIRESGAWTVIDLTYNTADFIPGAPLFKPHEFSQIIISDVGIFVWLGALAWWSYTRSFTEMFRFYFIPYLWVNHWLVLITFLQHTDPLLPHYRAPAFTFPRGALATLDRQLLGDLGPIGAWLGAVATHGISETHVAHHVSSKIPHYNAWEATYALRERLARAGIKLQGRPGGWSEVYRVYRECRVSSSFRNSSRCFVLIVEFTRSLSRMRATLSSTRTRRALRLLALFFQRVVGSVTLESKLTRPRRARRSRYAVLVWSRISVSFRNIDTKCLFTIYAGKRSFHLSSRKRLVVEFGARLISVRTSREFLSFQ